MSHYQTIKALGTPIVVHSNLTRFLGSATASILLSHIIYWSDRSDHDLGFYRTLGQIMAETALTENELRSARKLLTNLGLVKETYKRLEHKLYFKFESEAFDEWFDAQMAKCENHNYPLLNPQMPPVKTTDGGRENHNSLSIRLHNKITTKNTKESEYDTHAHENQNSQNSSQIKPSSQKPSAKKTNTVTDQLIHLGVSEQASNDFVDFRKQIKKPLTITAIKALQNESAKAGLSLEQAIEYTLNKGWQSFTAAYYFNNEKGSSNAAHQPNHHNNAQSNAEAYAQSLQQQYHAKYGQSSAGVTLDGNFYAVESQF